MARYDGEQEQETVDHAVVVQATKHGDRERREEDVDDSDTTSVHEGAHGCGSRTRCRAPRGQSVVPGELECVKTSNSKVDECKYGEMEIEMETMDLPPHASLAGSG